MNAFHTAYNILLGWQESLFAFFLKMVWKNLNKLLGQPNILCFNYLYPCMILSVQYSCSVVFNSLRHRESQHARPPCPLPTPGVYSNLCTSSRKCHPAISSSIVPFSSCLQSLPASGSFPMSQLFAWGGQSFGVSASASVLPMNTQDWSPLRWTGWISLQSKGPSRVFSKASSPKMLLKSISSLELSFLHSPTLTSIHDIWKNCILD